MTSVNIIILVCLLWHAVMFTLCRMLDEIWRIFRPHPQTFCSHARTRQNIVILKNLLSTNGFSTRNATFDELWPTNP